MSAGKMHNTIEAQSWAHKAGLRSSLHTTTGSQLFPRAAFFSCCIRKNQLSERTTFVVFFLAMNMSSNRKFVLVSSREAIWVMRWGVGVMR